MLNINLFRKEKGGYPDLVRESCKKRFKDVSIVDEVIETDEKWRKAKYDAEHLVADKKKISKTIGMKKKKKESCVEEFKKVKEIGIKIKELKRLEIELETKLTDLLTKVGNIVHESVPVSKDEEENAILRTWGTKPDLNKPLHHHHLINMIDGINQSKGRLVSGHRGYFLKGPIMLMNQALINYAIAFLYKKQYTPMQTPFFMKKGMMKKVAELADFEETLYSVRSGLSEEKEEQFLIATSEQPMVAYHNKEQIKPEQLPLKYVSYSSCFRKEAGKYGQETWGIFRVHQFEKVEQFVITSPYNDESWNMQETMIANSEEFYQSLGLPYRVVNIVSGELNDAAARKFDLEAWFPGYNNYKELVSCSNCLDYQSRSIQCKYWPNKSEKKKEVEFVHMLNGTLCATERCICCILENYQTEKGIVVPEVLRPYMFDIDFIPFVKTLEEVKVLMNNK
ncbi:seryl-tRNA synthetase [Anaeramoeba flamelloides]|uniref:serine--tRNA ligase n=1 Tax=Anaeramoeba flamelloides TaxID=1746091 RepID=A0ABQ8YIQ8_9EUKA|nr:seryl-tRNA synthetase [Anaeramoeba flamelloides]